jgi:hypothetical protein
MGDVKIMTKEEIRVFLDNHLDNPYFIFFLNSFLPKWVDLTEERLAIMQCVDSICKHWNCTKDELYLDKKRHEPRGVLFCLLKKHLDLSFEIIGDMFLKKKSQVHKIVTQVEFVIKQGKKKELIDRIDAVSLAVFGKPSRTDLSKNGAPVAHGSGVAKQGGNDEMLRK